MQMIFKLDVFIYSVFEWMNEKALVYYVPSTVLTTGGIKK